MLPITVPGAEASTTITPAATSEESIYVETMMQALEEELGMLVEVVDRKAAQAMRHRFYRARKAAIDRGIKSLDKVSISIIEKEGSFALHIRPIPIIVRPLTLEDLNL